MAKWNVLLNDRVVQTFEIDEGETLTIGRGKEVDVRIDNIGVSRRQATLEVRNGMHTLTDLESTNGTFVNGTRMEGALPVSGSDRIEMAKFQLILVDSKVQSAAASASPDLESTVYIVPKAGAGPDGKRPPRLKLVEGGAKPTRFMLKGRHMVRLGSEPTCDICISGLLVAKTQCYIAAKGDSFLLVNQGRWRKTTVNGAKVQEQELRSGDVIGIGRTKLKLE